MAKFHLRVIPRPGEYGRSHELGQIVELTLSGSLGDVHVGLPSRNEPALYGIMRCFEEKKRQNQYITVSADDENFSLDLFLEKKEEFRPFYSMYINEVRFDWHDVYQDPSGQTLATLFVRAWRGGPHSFDPMSGAKFIEGLHIDLKSAHSDFETYKTDAPERMVHPLRRFIGSDPMFLLQPPLDDEAEPMQ